MTLRLKEKYGDGKTVVTAHRGNSGEFPENTLTAFDEAVRAGADIVEFDVRATADGALVLLHDATVDRTTDGTGSVEGLTLAEVKRLNASYWIGPKSTGERMSRPMGEETIPTFEEALQALAGRVGLNIQVKTEGHAILDRILALYDAHELRETGFLMLSTFDEAAYVRRTAPGVAVCVGEQREDIERHREFGVDFIQPRRRDLSDDYIRRLKASGILANVYFANDPADMTFMLERGIPGILTDYPARLVRLLAEWKSNGEPS